MSLVNCLIMLTGALDVLRQRCELLTTAGFQDEAIAVRFDFLNDQVKSVAFNFGFSAAATTISLVEAWSNFTGQMRKWCSDCSAIQAMVNGVEAENFQVRSVSIMVV